MSRMSFDLLQNDGTARRGRLSFPRGTVETPAFMPVGTYGTVKGVLPRSLREMAQGFDNSFSRFALARSVRHREALLTLPFDAGSEKRFRRMAEESLAEQRRIEASDQMPFETYRQRYLAGELPLDDDR